MVHGPQICCSGDSFRKVFKRIGKLRSITPNSVSLMALTATAPKPVRVAVCKTLEMSDPYVVELSPDKPSVFLVCKPFTSLTEIFKSIADSL